MDGDDPQFEKWLVGYLELRNKASLTLFKRLPNEIAELMRESQDLEPLRWEAEEARAWAESYLSAKRTPRRVWARENTRGLCASIESRGMKIAQHLKLMDKSN